MALLLVCVIAAAIGAVVVTASMGYSTAAIVIGLVAGGTLSAALS